MSTLLIKNARNIITMDAQRRCPEGACSSKARKSKPSGQIFPMRMPTPSLTRREKSFIPG